MPNAFRMYSGRLNSNSVSSLAAASLTFCFLHECMSVLQLCPRYESFRCPAEFSQYPRTFYYLKVVKLLNLWVQLIFLFQGYLCHGQFLFVDYPRFFSGMLQVAGLACCGFWGLRFGPCAAFRDERFA